MSKSYGYKDWKIYLLFLPLIYFGGKLHEEYPHHKHSHLGRNPGCLAAEPQGQISLLFHQSFCLHSFYHLMFWTFVIADMSAVGRTSSRTSSSHGSSLPTELQLTAETGLAGGPSRHPGTVQQQSSVRDSQLEVAWSKKNENWVRFRT